MTCPVPAACICSVPACASKSCLDLDLCSLARARFRFIHLCLRGPLSPAPRHSALIIVIPPGYKRSKSQHTPPLPAGVRAEGRARRCRHAPGTRCRRRTRRGVPWRFQRLNARLAFVIYLGPRGTKPKPRAQARNPEPGPGARPKHKKPRHAIGPLWCQAGPLFC